MLIHYSFAYEGNKFDFCEIMLNMNPESLNVKDLVHVENDVSEDVQELRLKQDQLDDTMMAYLRMVINLKAKP